MADKGPSPQEAFARSFDDPALPNSLARDKLSLARPSFGRLRKTIFLAGEGDVMGKPLMSGSIIVFACVIGAAGEASAQCAREGEEVCQKGQVYRCEKLSDQLGLIFQNRTCVVNAPSLTGIWRGAGHQSPSPVGGATDWSIVMTISASGGSIQYPSLGCGGSLTQISRDAASAQYRETITFGNDVCINGGVVGVRYFRGRLSWTWLGQSDGHQVNATAVLTR
jgi:hypothetical protein